MLFAQTSECSEETFCCSFFSAYSAGACLGQSCNKHHNSRTNRSHLCNGKVS